MMWFLRVFAKQGSRLIGEFPMQQINVGILRQLLNRPEGDPMHCVYPVSPQMAETLSKFVEHDLDLEKYDYFVDYDA